jgi:hypothetical protein
MKIFLDVPFIFTKLPIFMLLDVASPFSLHDGRLLFLLALMDLFLLFSWGTI